MQRMTYGPADAVDSVRKNRSEPLYTFEIDKISAVRGAATGLGSIAPVRLRCVYPQIPMQRKWQRWTPPTQRDAVLSRRPGFAICAGLGDAHDWIANLCRRLAGQRAGRRQAVDCYRGGRC